MARRLNSDTVSGSLTSNTIVSLATVNAYLNIPNTSSGSNATTTASLSAFLTTAISWVSSEFENYYKRPIIKQTFYGLYDGDDTDFLYLRNRPIVSIDSLQTRDSVADSWTNVGISNIYLYDNKFGVYDDIFDSGNRNYAVNYTAGFDAVPPSVEKIAVEAVNIIYKESKVGEAILGTSSKNISGVSPVTFNYYRLTDEHKAVLDDLKKSFIYSS